MIVWLSSYPRAGIVVLRRVLRQCFGLNSYSREPDFLELLPQTARQVGFVAHGQAPRAFIEHAERSPELFLVKTFGTPVGDERAIHLVRDGRATLYSYWRLLTDQAARLDRGPEPTLEEVVVGRTPAGSWSQHVEDWTVISPNILQVRYEKLLAGDTQTIEQAAEFLGRRPLVKAANLSRPVETGGGEPVVEYESDAEGVAVIDAQCPHLFEAANGDVMRQLGYLPPQVEARSRAARGLKTA